MSPLNFLYGVIHLFFLLPSRGSDYCPSGVPTSFSGLELKEPWENDRQHVAPWMLLDPLSVNRTLSPAVLLDFYFLL